MSAIINMRTTTVIIAKTVMKRISPKAGRFVYFSGEIPHCASRPVENFKRMVININMSKE